MPIVDMRCPRCGKQATEYEKNKWRCLICNNKFIYETPVQPNSCTVEQHVNQTIFDKQAQPKTKWYFKTHWIVIAFLSVGPLALPMVWFNPRFSQKTKIIVSIVTIIIVILSYYLLGYLFTNLWKWFNTGYLNQTDNLFQGF